MQGTTTGEGQTAGSRHDSRLGRQDYDLRMDASRLPVELMKFDVVKIFVEAKNREKARKVLRIDAKLPADSRLQRLEPSNCNKPGTRDLKVPGAGWKNKQD
jgi:hypothetical protein